jgi:two-component system sensor histidine kinase QseC
MSWLERARRSLQGRLALGLVVGLLAAMTVSFVALHLLVRGELYNHLDEDLKLRMSAIAEYAAAHPGKESVVEFMPQFRTRTHEDFFQVWDSAGRTLARSDSSIGRDLPRLGAIDGTPIYRDLVLPDGHSGRAVAAVMELPAGDPRGALTVVTSEETEDLDRLEGRIHFLLLFMAVATAVAMLAIAHYSVQRGLRPVTEFARTLEGVNPEDPQTRLDPGPLPSELRPVAASFSALLNRLLEALAREKRYARNVAHELRNPLAEMRLLADVGAGSDPESARTVIRDIGATAAEMEQIVDSLMALTRYEAGLEIPQPEPVELGAELRAQARSLATATELRGLTMRLDVQSEVWVHTDSSLVRRLMANLFGNAISHAPPGSLVTVSLSPAGEVSVANPAPQLRSADVQRLSERFFRIGNGDNGSHAGLGLSLATAIAKVLGLGLTLRLREDGWLVATVAGFRSLGQSIATT